MTNKEKRLNQIEHTYLNKKLWSPPSVRTIAKKLAMHPTQVFRDIKELKATKRI